MRRRTGRPPKGRVQAASHALMTTANRTASVYKTAGRRSACRLITAAQCGCFDTNFIPPVAVATPQVSVCGQVRDRLFPTAVGSSCLSISNLAIFYVLRTFIGERARSNNLAAQGSIEIPLPQPSKLADWVSTAPDEFAKFATVPYLFFMVRIPFVRPARELLDEPLLGWSFESVLPEFT